MENNCPLRVIIRHLLMPKSAHRNGFSYPNLTSFNNVYCCFAYLGFKNRQEPKMEIPYQVETTQRPGPKVIKDFSCATQLSIKF